MLISFIVIHNEYRPIVQRKKKKKKTKIAYSSTFKCCVTVVVFAFKFMAVYCHLMLANKNTNEQTLTASIWQMEREQGKAIHFES